MPVTPKLFVTGASGQLGRLVIDTLLETTPGSAIVAGMRDPAKAEGSTRFANRALRFAPRTTPGRKRWRARLRAWIGFS